LAVKISSREVIEQVISKMAKVLELKTDLLTAIEIYIPIYSGDLEREVSISLNLEPD